MAKASSSSGVFSDGWDQFVWLIQNRWQNYLWYLVIKFVVSVVFLGSGLALLWPFFWEMIQTPDRVMEGYAFFSGYFPVIGLVLLLALATMVVEFWNYLGLIRVAVTPKAEQSISSIFHMGRERFWFTFFSLLAYGILVGLAVGLGSIALILPGIFLFVSLFLGSYEIITDGRGPIEALKSTYALVKGRWWVTFGTLLFWSILSWVLMTVIQMVFGLLSGSLLDFSQLDMMEAQIQGAMMSANFSEAASIVQDALTLILTPGAIAAFFVMILLQALATIVLQYGILSLYMTLKSTAK